MSTLRASCDFKRFQRVLGNTSELEFSGVSLDTEAAQLLEQQQAFQTKQRQQWENIRQLIFKNYPKAVFRDSTESKIKQVHLLANRDARVITTEELSTWQTECSYWQITLSEQLPPYHFV